VPIALYVVVNKFKLASITTTFVSVPRLTGPPRFETIFTGPGALLANLDAFWRLLVSGEDGLIWNAVPGYGYLYLLGLPLAVLGLVVLLRRERFWLSQVDFFFLAWLVVALLLAASESVDINRINIIFLPLVYFAAVGIHALGAVRVSNFRPALAAVLAYFCLEFALFTHAYFGSYRAEVSRAFFAHFGDAINTSAKETTGQVCITDRVTEPYVFVLFYRKIDPHDFVNTALYDDPHAAFAHVSSFGRYTFGLSNCDAATTQAYVADIDEAQSINARRFVRTARYGRYVVDSRR
jgi:hypothetical protein